MFIQVCQSGLSPKCVSAMNRLRAEILKRVLVRHLHFNPGAKGADLSVEKCTYADDGTHDAHCYVRLSDVSVTSKRSLEDFARAQKALEDLYAETVKEFPPERARVVSLSARIVLDRPLAELNGSNLIEAETAREIMIPAP